MDLRLTDKARRIVELARHAARDAGMSVVSPEMILAGIAQSGESCVAGATLKHLGVPSERLIDKALQRRIDAADSQCNCDELLLLAQNEARELKHDITC